MTQPPVVLYLFEPALGLPISESPPAAKVELYFQLTDVEYEARLGDTRRSPNKMIPYVRWPDGTFQAESWDIIDRAEAAAQRPLDQGIDPQRLASGRALAEQVELVCYNACLHDRFAQPEGWASQRPILRAYAQQLAPRLLWPALGPVLWDVRRRQVKRAAQTMADVEAGHARSMRLVDEVGQRLEQAAFVCGDEPSTVDCAIWPTLLHLGATPAASPSRDGVRQDTRVVEWIERVAQRAGVELGSTWRTQ